MREGLSRRGFLGAMLAAAVAPYVVRSGVLMPVKTLVLPPGVRDGKMWMPTTDLLFTAVGPVATFRYVVLYNSTSGKRIGEWDYGADVTLADTETFSVWVPPREERGPHPGGNAVWVDPGPWLALP